MVFSFFRRRPESTPPAPIAAAQPPELSKGATPPPPPATIAEYAMPIGPTLWQELRYGMDEAAARAARPDAVPNPKPDRLATGSLSTLYIPALRLGAHGYRVFLYFDGRALVQVTISSAGQPQRGDFHDLTNALRLRYGRETRLKEQEVGFSEAEWLSADGTNIHLVFYGDIEVLNVVFQYRHAAAAAQL